MADFDALYDQHAAQLEDFWGRRRHTPHAERDVCLFGRPIRLISNSELMLSAIDHSLPLFSSGPAVAMAPYSVALIAADDHRDLGTPPANPMQINRYSGYGNWLAIDGGVWGHAQVDLDARSAHIVLAPQMATRPEIVSTGFLNTVLLNFIHSSGFSMLHCTALSRDDRLLLLLAPHNSGKSTTALRLALNGHKFVSDSQIHVSPDHDSLTLFGFPVGRGKLRADMVPHFPDLQPFLSPETVRDEFKYVLDLHAVMPERVETRAVSPRQIDLCLLQRHSAADSTFRPAAAADVWQTIMQNSIFYDSRTTWKANHTQIERLLRQARCWRLTIGSDPQRLVACVDELQAAHPDIGA